MVVNCNSSSGKKAEIENLLYYTKADILLLCETKIDKTINTSEFLPNHYKGDNRKNRVLGGGGVMIAMKSNIFAEEVEININAEIVCAAMSLKNHEKIYVGSFYIQYDGTVQDMINKIEELDESLNYIDDKMKNNPRCTVILGVTLMLVTSIGTPTK